MKVLGISGSLRADSFNSRALLAAKTLAPQDITIEIAHLHAIPLFDADLLKSGEPTAVAQLRSQIRDADAVLIATPEYNSSLPGVLKNALDWMSLPPQPPFIEKPVAILGASVGVTGTARVQQDLRKVITAMNGYTVNKPEVLIREAPTKFNADGELTDEATRGFIGELLVSLQRLRHRLRD